MALKIRTAQRLQHHVGRAVPEWVFVLVDDPAPAIDGQALGGDGRAGDVAAHAFQTAPLMRLADTGSMQGESCHPGQQRDARRCLHGRDAIQGKSLAPGVGTDGNSIIHGCSLQLVQAGTGFEIERSTLRVCNQQAPPRAPQLGQNSRRLQLNALLVLWPSDRVNALQDFSRQVIGSRAVEFAAPLQGKNIIDHPDKLTRGRAGVTVFQGVPRLVQGSNQ